MTYLSKIRSEIADSIAAKQALLQDDDLIAQIESVAFKCVSALQSGGKIIFAGNGGSFADAQHLSAEFVSRFRFDRAPLASVALGTNNSAISAIGNDYGYDQVFARELRAIAGPQDVFIGISTSGNSKNVLAAVAAAEQVGVFTTCLTGQSGGLLAKLCACMKMPSEDTARIQECHILTGHIICGLVEELSFQDLGPSQ